MIARLRRWRHQRRLAAEWQTLWALRDGRQHFGADLWKTTGLRAGRLYPAFTHPHLHVAEPFRGERVPAARVQLQGCVFPAASDVQHRVAVAGTSRWAA